LGWVRRTISIIDSHGFVLSSVRFRLPWTPSRVSVSVSSMPSRSEPAAPEYVRSSSPASRLQAAAEEGAREAALRAAEQVIKDRREAERSELRKRLKELE
jgi:hypothetical protein